jgi:hypothetical protein
MHSLPDIRLVAAVPVGAVLVYKKVTYEQEKEREPQASNVGEGAEVVHVFTEGESNPPQVTEASSTAGSVQPVKKKAFNWRGQFKGLQNSWQIEGHQRSAENLVNEIKSKQTAPCGPVDLFSRAIRRGLPPG